MEAGGEISRRHKRKALSVTKVRLDLIFRVAGGQVRRLGHVTEDATQGTFVGDTSPRLGHVIQDTSMGSEDATQNTSASPSDNLTRLVADAIFRSSRVWYHGP